MTTLRRTSKLARLVAVVSLTALAAPAVADRRSLWMRHTHTGEEIRVSPFVRFGKMRSAAWRRLNRFLRSWRTQKRRTMHPRLFGTLAQIQTHFDGRRLDIVSAYRTTDAENRPSSYHHVGRAIDLNVVGTQPRELFDYCLALSKQRALGCGYYPGRFVHVDIRGESGLWVDLSGSGQPPRYVTDVRGWLARHPDR